MNYYTDLVLYYLCCNDQLQYNNSLLSLSNLSKY